MTPSRRAGPALLALLVGVIAGAALAACAASKPRATASSPTAMGDLEHRATGHDPAIEALDQQIGHDLDRLGLAPPDDDELTALLDGGDAAPMPLGIEAASTCERPPAGDACGDVCAVATSICGNARRICELAAEPDGDAWAARRCASGKASCQRATARCCGC